MPGGGLPGVGRFTMGGKHNESWFKLNSLLEKKQVKFSSFLIFFSGIHLAQDSWNRITFSGEEFTSTFVTFNSFLTNFNINFT